MGPTQIGNHGKQPFAELDFRRDGDTSMIWLVQVDQFDLGSIQKGEICAKNSCIGATGVKNSIGLMEH